jgi:predicted nucleic acid-binding Zn ribbon protein
MQPCLHCQNEVKNRFANALYCSALCQADAKEERRRKRAKMQVRYYLPHVTGKCVNCDAEFPWAYHKLYCSNDCRNEKRRERYKRVAS